MSTLADIGEAGLLARLKTGIRSGPGVLQGIGDDAAAYDLGDGRVLLLTVDTMVAGEHFLMERMPMRLVGRKAMASSISDIAAMNGRPQCAVVALSAPGATPAADIDALYRGLQERAQDYGTVLVGGDTTRSRTMSVSVTITGEVRKGEMVLRSGAQPGDLLCVTGPLGASHAGLRWMLSGRPGGEPALAAHFDPSARLDIVQHWRQRGMRPHALTDISDGLATEVHHLCEASHCGAVIDADRLPVSSIAEAVAAELGEVALDYALYWGEDYELLLYRHLRLCNDPRP